MINPCVIIATHERLSITTTNIKLLLAQGVQIILVVSDSKEKEYYSQFPINLVMHPNKPLGAKWQAGVDYARIMNPSHYIPLGSDDLLSNDFFEKYCINGLDFVGFEAWYIWNGLKLYKCHYNAKQPLGGGRIYSRSIMTQMDFELFDRTKNKLLDDFAWNNMPHGTWDIKYEPEILAVKGNWPVMNPVDLKHRNVKLLATYEGQEALKIMKDKFNYEP